MSERLTRKHRCSYIATIKALCEGAWLFTFSFSALPWPSHPSCKQADICEEGKKHANLVRHLIQPLSLCTESASALLNDQQSLPVLIQRL